MHLSSAQMAQMHFVISPPGGDALVISPPGGDAHEELELVILAEVRRLPVDLVDQCQEPRPHEKLGSLPWEPC